MKICPKCGMQYSIENFCEDCEDENGFGIKLVGRSYRTNYA